MFRYDMPGVGSVEFFDDGSVQVEVLADHDLEPPIRIGLSSVDEFGRLWGVTANAVSLLGNRTLDAIREERRERDAGG